MAPRTKVSRNAPCPCGSGKKYKHCHGSIKDTTVNKISWDKWVKQKSAEFEARQIQIEKQQGLGREIVSTIWQDRRVVAVGNRIHLSTKWKTFHDFLFEYIIILFSREWWRDELKKKPTARHPVLNRYELACKYQKQIVSTPGKIYTAPMTGAIAAYLWLSYNLYLIAHNSRVQEVLIDRLKDLRQFHGAYYETFVAAALIKAGFKIEFEDESDSSTSHCEFTATSPKTNAKFSVEAKSRQDDKSRFDVGGQLYKALRKVAAHPRLIFIDINVPDNTGDDQSMVWMEKAITGIRNREHSMTINGKPASQAYVVVTNHPYHRNLESVNIRRGFVAEGFKIPDFKINSEFLNIRDVLRMREKHSELLKLIDSLHTHYVIPSTFDGDIPELAFSDEKSQRLLIGRKYPVPIADGTEVEGTLLEACVLTKEKLVYGVYRLQNGRQVVATCPITDSELLAYQRYPDTFFGVPRQGNSNVSNPLELFDFLHNTYKHTSREKLLEFLRSHPKYTAMQELNQRELAITYCEELVYSMMQPRPNAAG